MRRSLPIAILVLATAVAACSADPSPTPSGPCPTSAPTEVAAQVILEDAAQATVTVSGAVSGEFVIELLGDAAPIATANFVALARCGFYDGIKFHRVLAGFVIQAGDPGTKSHEGDFEGLGQGGPGYRFAIEPPADELDYAPYSVSMANAAPSVPDSNGSQFFVALADLSQLPRDYTIFGDVVSGTDVIDAIAAVPVNDPQIGVPLAPITIDSVIVSAVSASPSPD
jgi:peptidyl-prolyl cis-trans isomerase B (cyclophilin B)